MDENILTTEIKLRIQGVEAQELKNVMDTLYYFRSTISEINRELDPKEKVEIFLKPVQKGSFEYLFILADPKNVVTLLQIYGIGKKIIEVFMDFVKLKKLLKGEKPAEVKTIEQDKVEIKNNAGDILVVNGNSSKIYQLSPTVNVNIENLFLVQSRDENVTEIKISEGDNVIQVEKSDFPILYGKNELIEDLKKSKETIKNNVKLRIHKLIFESNTKWDFFYRGHKIKAKIMDTDFSNKVDNDEIKFSKHLILDVQLKIMQEFDPKLKVYKDIEYIILHVNSVEIVPEQGGLFDN